MSARGWSSSLTLARSIPWFRPRFSKRLGVRSLSQEEFRLAKGSKVVRKKGVAVFRHEGRVGRADVIFGEEADSNLLGATTLESLGLSLDPLRRELKPLPMILASVVR